MGSDITNVESINQPHQLALADEVVDPVCMEGGKRVIRGGSWTLCRSANRDSYNPGYKGYNIGFRLAMWP